MNNIFTNFKKDECCGCTACKSICPKQAITMKEDEKGFSYPFIDESKCVNCGLCIQTCDFRKFKPTKKQPTAYLFQLKDENDRMKSQSGGAFIALARYVISKGGCVFGCELNENLVAVHNCYETLEGINKFRGSKYVLSNLKKTFLECCKKLNEGQIVLFSGTGCQVHGLISFLKYKRCNTEKLITCDIVCHGGPSPNVFETYKKILGKENKSNIFEFKFRSKENNGWHSHMEKIAFKNGNLETNRWATIFYKHIIFRDSCYKCKYTTTNRLTDITICDAWRTDNEKDKFDDNKGTSLILCHSFKGENIIKNIEKANLEKLVEDEFEKYKQPQLISPPEKGDEYAAFWNLYVKKKILAFNLFTKSSLFYKCARKIKRTLIWKKK